MARFHCGGGLTVWAEMRAVFSVEDMIDQEAERLEQAFVAGQGDP